MKRNSPTHINPQKVFTGSSQCSSQTSSLEDSGEEMLVIQHKPWNTWKMFTSFYLWENNLQIVFISKYKIEVSFTEKDGGGAWKTLFDLWSTSTYWAHGTWQHCLCKQGIYQGIDHLQFISIHWNMIRKKRHFREMSLAFGKLCWKWTQII